MHKLALFVQKGYGCKGRVQPPRNTTGSAPVQNVAEHANFLGNDVDHATCRLGRLDNSKHVRVANSRSSVAKYNSII